MKTFGYVRSSRPPKSARARPGDPTTDSPLGIESQRREILERFPDAAIFEDRFRSGRSARRPGLLALLDAVEPGSRVVVCRLDRLARDSALAVHLEYQIERVLGARLVSLAGEGYPLDGPPDPTAIFVRRIVAAQAELVAAQASASTRSALAVKRAAGMSTNGHAPYGYRVEGDGRIVEDDQEQVAIAAIVERLRGRLFGQSSADLADHLNRRGFRNRAGKPWHRSGVARILRALQAKQRETVET